MWIVYILKCKNKFLYTGITTDLKRRFHEHRIGRGACFTARNKPTKILYSEEQPSLKDAMKREREIKKWPREKKLALVDANKPVIASVSEALSSFHSLRMLVI